MGPKGFRLGKKKKKKKKKKKEMIFVIEDGVPAKWCFNEHLVSIS